MKKRELDTIIFDIVEHIHDITIPIFVILILLHVFFPLTFDLTITLNLFAGSELYFGMLKHEEKKQLELWTKGDDVVNEIDNNEESIQETKNNSEIEYLKVLREELISKTEETNEKVKIKKKL